MSPNGSATPFVQKTVTAHGAFLLPMSDNRNTCIWSVQTKASPIRSWGK